MGSRRSVVRCSAMNKARLMGFPAKPPAYTCFDMCRQRMYDFGNFRSSPCRLDHCSRLDRYQVDMQIFIRIFAVRIHKLGINEELA